MEVEITVLPDGSKKKIITDHIAVVGPLRTFYERQGHAVECEPANPGVNDLWKLTITMRPPHDT